MDKDMMNKDNEIQKTNGMTKVSEEVIESVTGGYDPRRYNAIYNDSNMDWASKKATLGAYLQRVDNIFWKKKTTGLTQAQINDLHFERAHLKELIAKLNAQR